MLSGISRLPPELLLKIFERLLPVPGDILLNCMRCCKAWHQSARSALYRDVVLTSASLLQFFVHSRSDIYESIQSLTLRLDPLPSTLEETQTLDSLARTRKEGGQAAHQLWRALNGFGLRIKDMANLTSLSIYRVPGFSGRPDFWGFWISRLASIIDNLPATCSEWMKLLSFISKVRPDKTTPQMPPTWGTIEGVRGELEATGFREIEVYTLETSMQFNAYDEIPRYILTQFPNISKMTSGMSREELDKVLNLMIEYMKSKHPVAPGRLTGTAIIGVGRK